MKEQITAKSTAKVPGRLIEQLRTTRIFRRLQHRWARNRDVCIRYGVGAGLRFNAVSANPDFALGTIELPVQQALADYLRLGDVFYDIGANIGFFTVLGARLVGNGGKVEAFEPVPANVTAARHNCALNGFQHVVVNERAVASRTGIEELLVTHDVGGATLLSAGLPPDVKEKLSVRTVAIDDLVSNRQIMPPNLVKVDVEGAELAVFEGMTATLREFRPPVIYEIDDETRAGFERKQAECNSFWAALSYQSRRLEDSYPGIVWHVGHYLALPTTPI